MFSDDSIWQLEITEANSLVFGRQVVRAEPAVPLYASMPKDTLFRVVANTTGELPPISLWAPEGIQVQKFFIFILLIIYYWFTTANLICKIINSTNEKFLDWTRRQAVPRYKAQRARQGGKSGS